MQIVSIKLTRIKIRQELQVYKVFLENLQVRSQKYSTLA
jgi:hypothetical protein